MGLNHLPKRDAAMLKSHLQTYLGGIKYMTGSEKGCRYVEISLANIFGRD